MILPPLTESELIDFRKIVHGASECTLRPMAQRMADELLARVRSAKPVVPQPKRTAAPPKGTDKFTQPEEVKKGWGP
jgi:hypothetical protein